MHLFLIMVFPFSITPGIIFLMLYFTIYGKVSYNSSDSICICKYFNMSLTEVLKFKKDPQFKVLLNKRVK